MECYIKFRIIYSYKIHVDVYAKMNYVNITKIWQYSAHYNNSSWQRENSW